MRSLSCAPDSSRPLLRKTSCRSRKRNQRKQVSETDSSLCFPLLRLLDLNALCDSFPAFEELERALGVAQRAEEARRQLQVNTEEQVKQVAKASEEERRSLQHELTRVKQEVVTIMKVCIKKRGQREGQLNLDCS